MKFGYACVSNGEQNLALQIDALKAAERIFEGQGLSGATVFKRAYTELADWLKAVELDRLFKRSSRSSMITVAPTGSSRSATFFRSPLQPITSMSQSAGIRCDCPCGRSAK